MFVDEVTGGQAIHFSQSEESQCEKDGMQLQFSSKLAIPHSWQNYQFLIPMNEINTHKKDYIHCERP